MSFRILPALFALLCLSPAAFAATYRCEVSGSVILTDKPCAGSGPAPMGSIGPTRTTSSYQTALPKMEQAPEYQRYLSQRCAELSEAVRTAPARGVAYATVNDLRREYSRDCSDDEQYARRKASEARRRDRDGQLAMRDDAERSREDAERLREKCIELRDSLRNRRVENETERLNKKAAEDAYNASCLGK
ncbi:hypothetical protein ACS5PN_30965 [Roseateles sp. NT4]|uniref:hypothetical protein n=1 Tax=Roseateles sp. NT4 TaxID=3453715 RepID=UPI003EEEE0E0